MLAIIDYFLSVLCNFVFFSASTVIEVIKPKFHNFCFRIVSAIQAVLSSFSGAVVCTFSCPKNMLRTSHFMSQAYAWFGASYFLYDVYSMFVVSYNIF